MKNAVDPPQEEKKRMDKRRTIDLDGKCGTCRHFTLEPGKECCGFCSGRMKHKGRIDRSRHCAGYEVAPIIASEKEKKTVAAYIFGEVS
jgi:hypothetical protein